jgi:hypothetical protein
MDSQNMKNNILALTCLLILAACGNDAPATQISNNQPVESVSVPKKLERYVVGTDATYPPFDFKDEHGQLTGFDADLLKAIADNQNFSIEFIPTARSQLFPSLNEGYYQILAACLGINAERLAQSEMSEPYAFAPNVIMGKTGNNVQTLAQLGNSSVAVQQDSYTHKVLTDSGIKNIITEKTPYEAYVDFVSGRADYVVGDAGVLNYYHKNNKDTHKPQTYSAVYNKTEDVRVAFAVKKGNTELINKINEGLKNIKANGTYDKIYAKWFGTDNSLRVPEENNK